MQATIKPTDIHIRTHLQSGDLGYVIYRQAMIYQGECQYGLSFESYLCAGIYEFYHHYDPALDRVWICEHGPQIVGFLVLMHRPNNSAQFRYFYLEPEYRGLGLGKKLMDLFMKALQECRYDSAYLWTTQEQHTAIALYERYGFHQTEAKASTDFGKALIEQRFDLILSAGHE